MRGHCTRKLDVRHTPKIHYTPYSNDNGTWFVNRYVTVNGFTSRSTPYDQMPEETAYELAEILNRFAKFESEVSAPFWTLI